MLRSIETNGKSDLARLVTRRMEISDVSEVAGLEQELFTDAWSVDSFLAEVERRPEVGYPFVIRDGRDLVAYGVVWFIVDEIHIGNFAVRPDRQGRGIGSLMMEHVLEEGRRRSMTFATLEVRPSNEPALSLYQRFGFRKVALRKGYYRDNREDALVLAYALDPAAESRFA